MGLVLLAWLLHFLHQEIFFTSILSGPAISVREVRQREILLSLRACMARLWLADLGEVLSEL